MDCSLMTSECIDARLKEGRSGIVCKIDMKKTYDHVSWELLDFILKKMGFEQKWRNWMRIWCLALLSLF